MFINRPVERDRIIFSIFYCWYLVFQINEKNISWIFYMWPPSSFLTKRSTPSGGFLKEKEYSFLTKRSTPFGQFVEQKEYSFCSIFRAKGVLVWNFWFFFFQASTPFALKIGKKEYSFWSIFIWKGVLLFPNYWTKRSVYQVYINLYLCCLWCNLDMWNHFLHLQNLRNSILASARATERGIVL